MLTVWNRKRDSHFIKVFLLCWMQDVGHVYIFLFTCNNVLNNGNFHFIFCRHTIRCCTSYFTICSQDKICYKQNMSLKKKHLMTAFDSMMLDEIYYIATPVFQLRFIRAICYWRSFHPIQLLNLCVWFCSEKPWPCPTPVWRQGVCLWAVFSLNGLCSCS